MPSKTTIHLIVSLDSHSYRIILRYAQEHGLGRNDFSTALSAILRDWFALRMIARSSEQFRSARPTSPLVSLQDKIRSIKASLRGYQQPAGEVLPVSQPPPDRSDRNSQA